MSTTTIRNVHERRIAATPDSVWRLLMAMSGPEDRLWPSGVPPLRLDGPLAVGARGGHGPIRYELTSLDPRAHRLAFHFREPTGLVGHHSFHVTPDGRTGTVLRHELVATPQGWMRLRWPLMVRWVHDAVLEEVLDRAEVATGSTPTSPHRRSPWVRLLLASSAPRPRATPVPVASAAGEALARVDWADSYRMALAPDAPTDPEAWRRGMSGLGRRSRLLRLRIAGGDVLRRWTGAPGLGPDGPFPVLRRTPDEVLVGLDDTHLTFRATIGVDRTAGGRTHLVVTTAVMFHNAWGRRYMTAITPFHRHLVRSSMRRTARRVTPSPTTGRDGLTRPGPAEVTR